MNFITYLKTMLTDTQVRILARALTDNCPVCFYGSGYGKSTLAETLRGAGYPNAYAPEDCTDNPDCNSVLTKPGAVALCMKKEPFTEPLKKDSFSEDEIRVSLAEILKRAH